jgi:hypothetical protein
MARTAPSPDTIPLAMAILAVGTVLGGLLVGIEPIGGDADQMYRPIKTELAKALRAGSLPFWSDRFGLGVPLLAESHAAALYPPNLVFYRVLDMARAYRWSMWLHHLALVAATYGYARCLGIGPWGSALAGLAFTLCGFLAIHATHEPFYHILPYLLAVLIVAERYLATGRWLWMVLLALVFGVELTLGHFQLQAWTAGLVLFLGFWRVVIDSRPSGTGIPACSSDTPAGPAVGEDRGDSHSCLSPSGNGRISGWLGMLGLAGALVWGGAIAGVQLAASWELFQVSRAMQRPATDLMFFSYPPAHWAELALPRLFRGLREGPEDRYWMEMGATRRACMSAPSP